MRHVRHLLLVIAAVVSLGATAAAGGATRAPSVRDLSWTDRDYDLGDGNTYRFVQGGYREVDEDQQCLVCLQILGVSFGDVDRDGKDEAIVIVGSNLGGAGTMIDGYVFGLEKGVPVLRLHIDGGDRGDGGLASVKVVGGDVVVRRFDLAPSDGVCCPSRVIVERWRWSNGKLEKRPGPPRIEKRARRSWRLRR